MIAIPRRILKDLKWELRFLMRECMTWLGDFQQCEISAELLISQVSWSWSFVFYGRVGFWTIVLWLLTEPLRLGNELQYSMQRNGEEMLERQIKAIAEAVQKLLRSLSESLKLSDEKQSSTQFSSRHDAVPVCHLRYFKKNREMFREMDYHFRFFFCILRSVEFHSNSRSKWKAIHGLSTFPFNRTSNRNFVF